MVPENPSVSVFSHAGGCGMVTASGIPECASAHQACSDLCNQKFSWLNLAIGTSDCRRLFLVPGMASVGESGFADVLRRGGIRLGTSLKMSRKFAGVEKSSQV